MLDILVQLLEANIDYKSIIVFGVVYVCSLWFLFSLWVFLDAKKRYEESWKAILFFFVVFLLNFPALIFYLIVRPDMDDENLVLIQGQESGTSSNGGINIPLVNFIGQDGEVDLSFQIKLNKRNIHNEGGVNVSIDWDGTDNRFQKAPVYAEEKNPIVGIELEEGEKNESVLVSTIMNKSKSLLNKFKGGAKNIVSSMKSYTKKIEIEEDLMVSEVPFQGDPSINPSVNKDSSSTETHQKKVKKNKKKKKRK